MKFPLLVAALLTFAASAHAEKPLPPSPVTVTDAWVKITVPGARVSAAYMKLKSTEPVKLIKVEAAIAGIVEIHDMRMNDGVMEMEAMDALNIPANTTVTLKPGGMHVMLLKVNKPIKQGDKVPLTLTFLGKGEKVITAKLLANALEKAPSAELRRP